MLNQIMLMGNLVADPELRTTAAGVPCCRFRIAVSRPKAKDSNAESEADFFHCVAWNAQAEVAAKWLRKGKQIMLVGSLRNNYYTDADGVKHYSEQVVVKELYFTGTKQQNEEELQDVPF